MFTILVLAVLNNSPIADLPLPINITALFINIIAPFINALNTQLIETKVITNYSKDLITLIKIYIEKSKYSREDDNFNCKLIIFNDFYNRVNIL